MKEDNEYPDVAETLYKLNGTMMNIKQNTERIAIALEQLAFNRPLTEAEFQQKQIAWKGLNRK